MSDNPEEKVLISPSSSWYQYDFNDELYQAFMNHLKPDFGIIHQEEIGGGLSGSRTSSVRIDGTGQVKMGHYVLKVSLLKKAEQEMQKHIEAKASPILRNYVPDLIDSKVYPDPSLPLKGILYQIAGGGQLMRITLQKSLEEHHFPSSSTEELARIMLKWNFESTQIIRTIDLLGSLLKEVGKEHLPTLVEKLKGIVDYPMRPHLVLSKLGIVKYNPIYFLLDRQKNLLQQRRTCLIPTGILHGDLHPGNVIIPANETPHGSFQVIDFARSRHGNVFFDLAYLELCILLNSFSGAFHSSTELRRWWELEEHLISDPLLSEEYLLSDALLKLELERFPGDTEGLRRILPIRRALAQRMSQDNFQDDYRIAFLCATVGAGLDLARKIRHRSVQRVAFLTAVSRFNYLLEKMYNTIEIPLQGERSQATMYWPEEEPPQPLQDEMEEKRISALSLSSRMQEGGAKFPLVWPGEVIHRSALYDPWGMVDGVHSVLVDEHDQGVLLVGGRRFGKSSFFNSVSDLLPKRRGMPRAVRLDTLDIHHSAQSFAIELLEKLCQSVDLQNSPRPYDGQEKDFDSGRFFQAFQSVVDKKKRMRFVVCIDEIDSTLATTSSREEAKAILQILHKLLTSPGLPVRLLLTAANPEVLRLLRELRDATGFVENLGIWKIPLCSELETSELIERFDVPMTFQEEAISRIFKYSGGQIYFIKLAVRLTLEAGRDQSSRKSAKKSINAQMIDDLMHIVIVPTPTTSLTIRNIHEPIFDTMGNIYTKFFSRDEQQFMQLLTKASGILPTSSLQESESQLITIANRLHQMGYISKTLAQGKEDEVYTWRIGIWQLFLEDYYQLKYQKSHGKQ